MEKPGLQIKIDNRPLYDQAIDAIKQFIEQGNFQPGDKLPKEDALAQQLGISRPTLREALGRMEGQGVIMRRHGVGTFVTSPSRGMMRGGLEELHSLYSLASNAGVEAKRNLWRIEILNCSPEVAHHLNIDPGTATINVQMTAEENGHCFAYLNSYLPEKIIDIQELSEFLHGSLLDFLLQGDKVQLSYTKSNIYSVASDRLVSQLLHIPKGKPLLYLEETFFTRMGEPVVWTRNYFITDELNFHINRRIVR
jgi:GntR family transcriptional regulator